MSVLDPELPANWQDDFEATRDIGSQFVRQNKASLLRVPSIVMPRALNFFRFTVKRDGSRSRPRGNTLSTAVS